MGLGAAIGNGIPFQDKRNEDIPEICFIITELDEFLRTRNSNWR